MTTSTRYWKSDQLAEHLGVTKGWVYERTRVGGPEIIPHLKLGKYIRFDPESPEFQDWLARHTVSGAVG